MGWVVFLLFLILIAVLTVGGSKVALRFLATLAILAGAVIAVLRLFAPVAPT
jgi:hypothetical protein